jgi:hypothetical protein
MQRAADAPPTTQDRFQQWGTKITDVHESQMADAMRAIAALSLAERRELGVQALGRFQSERAEFQQAMSEIFARTGRGLRAGLNTSHPWYASTLASLKTNAVGLRGVTSSSRKDK